VSAENKKSERKKPIGRPFAKGVSGNPGGRPKGYQEAREACRKLDDETREVLVRLMRKSKSEMIRVMCATRLRDEAWGKPTQAITGADGGPIQFVTKLTDAQLAEEAARVMQQLANATPEERPS
jgi:hypothetical protein